MPKKNRPDPENTEITVTEIVVTATFREGAALRIDGLKRHEQLTVEGLGQEATITRRKDCCFTIRHRYGQTDHPGDGCEVIDHILGLWRRDPRPDLPCRDDPKMP